MAVKFKITNTATFAKKLGCSDKFVSMLKIKSIDLKLVNSNLVFSYIPDPDAYYFKVPYDTSFSSNEEGHNEELLALIYQNMTTFVNDLPKHTGIDNVKQAFKYFDQSLSDPVEKDVLMGFSDKLSPLKQLTIDKTPDDYDSMHSQAKKIMSTFFPSDSEYATSDQKPVALIQAKKMYQPVRGSNIDSIYHVVGLGDKLYVAARYNTKTLSVRVEGEVKTYKKQLELAGFSLVNLNNGYVSIHLEASNLVMATRAIGALLAGISLQIITPMPSLAAIQGKGV